MSSPDGPLGPDGGPGALMLRSWGHRDGILGNQQQNMGYQS